MRHLWLVACLCALALWAAGCAPLPPGEGLNKPPASDWEGPQWRQGGPV